MMIKKTLGVMITALPIAALSVACAAPEDVPDDTGETTETQSSALRPAPGGGGEGEICGSSCSVTCSNGSCSASGKAGEIVCCSCSGGTPICRNNG